MEIKLYKLNPQNDKNKVWAFADFIISFGDQGIRIKGCIVMLGKKNTFIIRMPVIPKALFKSSKKPDAGERPTPYSPLCWGSKADFDEFKLKACEAITSTYPIARWPEGMWCQNQVAGIPRKKLEDLPEIEKGEINDLLPKREWTTPKKPFNKGGKPFKKPYKPYNTYAKPNMVYTKPEPKGFIK